MNPIQRWWHRRIVKMELRELRQERGKNYFRREQADYKARFLYIEARIHYLEKQLR